MGKILKSNINIAQNIIQNALHRKQYTLLEPEAMQIIRAYGIPVPAYIMVSSPEEAIQAASFIGYPVVLKIVSPEIVHKTDAGGVKSGINSDKGVKVAYNEIIENIKRKIPKAGICGVLVEEMAESSIEIIVGGLRDPQFGPVVMFGMGGIFVEVFRDVSFRIVPVDEHEALDMIRDVKGARVLKGIRGQKPLDIYAVIATILRVSDIMVTLEEIQEIDINPIFVYPEGVKAVDAKIILK